MKPIRIDRRTKVRDIIGHAIHWCRLYGRTSTCAARRDLMMSVAGEGSDADPDKIDRMKGGPETWSDCDGCGRKVAAVAKVGEGNDPEGVVALLCRDCLIVALELLPEPVEVIPCSGS
jgi:hypothetical protein